MRAPQRRLPSLPLPRLWRFRCSHIGGEEGAEAEAEAEAEASEEEAADRMGTPKLPLCAEKMTASCVKAKLDAENHRPTSATIKVRF